LLILLRRRLRARFDQRIEEQADEGEREEKPQDLRGPLYFWSCQIFRHDRKLSCKSVGLNIAANVRRVKASDVVI
jgi:hypothetical protein